MRQTLLLLWLLLVAGLQGCATSQPNSVTVMVTGVGATVEEARRGAFRDAIQLAYGSLNLSERRVVNDRLFEDDVSYARGVIESFKEISRREDPKDRQQYVQMSVTVSPTAVQRRMLAAQDSSRVDGKELGRQIDIGRQQASSEVERYMSARRLFEHVTRGFATALFDVKAGQLLTLRDGAKIALVVDVTASMNEKVLQSLCSAGKSYHTSRTSSVPAQYRESLLLLSIRHAYDCSADIEVEPEHMGPMAEALASLGICLAVSDGSGQVLHKSFYQPATPMLVKGQLLYNAQNLAPGVYLLGGYRNYRASILLVRWAWGNDEKFRLELPSLPEQTVARISKVTATLSSDEGCTGPKPSSPLGLRLTGSAGAVMVAAIERNTPAEQANLRVGDQVLAIDGVSVQAMTPQQVAARLTGRPGSALTVLVFRKNEGRRVSVRVVVR